MNAFGIGVRSATSCRATSTIAWSRLKSQQLGFGAPNACSSIAAWQRPAGQTKLWSAIGRGRDLSRPWSTARLGQSTPRRHPAPARRSRSDAEIAAALSPNGHAREVMTSELTTHGQSGNSRSSSSSCSMILAHASSMTDPSAIADRAPSLPWTTVVSPCRPRRPGGRGPRRRRDQGAVASSCSTRRATGRSR
jgi:hypothetical protein